MILVDGDHLGFDTIPHFQVLINVFDIVFATSEMCTIPEPPPSILMNAPKLVILLTFPSTTVPTLSCIYGCSSKVG